MPPFALPRGCGRTAFAPAPSLRRARVEPLTVVHSLMGPGKKWEHYKLTKNGKPVRHKLHVKTGDKVIVIAGKDKGKTGTIQSVNRKTNQVKMEGVNMSIRHIPPEQEGEQGERVEKEALIAASNVMHWSEKEQVRSRLGKKMVDGKKVRYLIKTGEVLDN